MAESMDNPHKTPKPSRENVPIDLDEFPSVYTRDFVTENGIPCTVFTTPYDDLSTIENDTIGHTVYPWDILDEDRKRTSLKDRSDDEQNHSIDCSDSRILPGNDDADEKDNQTPTTGRASGYSSHAKPTRESCCGESKSIDSDSKNPRHDDIDRRRWRCYMILAIVGPIISALLVGIVIAVILTRNGGSGQESVSTNSELTGGMPQTSPTESPITSPTAAATVPKEPSFGSGVFSLEPSISTPNETPDDFSGMPVSAFRPSTQSPSARPIMTVTPTLLVTQRPAPGDTQAPTSRGETNQATPNPTQAPTKLRTSLPTQTPTRSPTMSPTKVPTRLPTLAPTQVQSPTRAPLTSTEENFLNILQNSASSEEYLRSFTSSTTTSMSPQWRALEWLTQDPTYLSYSDDRKIQRYALAVFGFGLESLPDTNTWLDYNTHECDWYTTATSGASCSSSSNGEGALVQRIQLDNLGLVGILPIELGLLSNSLTQIYLQNNALSGTLPSIWGQDFQRLRRFQLTNGRLEGTLPSEWGRMTLLGVVGLGRNRLTGSLPAEWATLGGMASLGTLGLERNELTGSIPTTWGNGGMASLKRLSLDQNMLTGQVPDSLWSTNDWEVVNLAGNFLTGAISDSTCNIATISELVADCSTGDVVCNCCTTCL